MHPTMQPTTYLAIGHTAPAPATGRTSRRAQLVRRLGLLAVTITLAATAVPAVAQPTGPSDLAPNPPAGDPDVALSVSDTCDPAGVTYDVAVIGGPDRPSTVRVDWSSADSGHGGSVDGAEGHIPTGEGAFEFVAVVTFPEVITLDQQVLAAVSITSTPEAAHVTCDDPGGTPTPTPVPTDPDIVVATPTFTG